MDAVEAAVRSVPGPNVTYVGSFDLAEHPVRITEEVRRACEANYCGHYGRNRACPPHAPPCQTCAAMLSRYIKVILIRTTFARDGPFDLEGMERASEVHAGYSFDVRRILRGIDGLEFTMLGAGPCTHCSERPCPEDGCRSPPDRMFSIEAYGIDLTSFLVSNGIDRRGGDREQSYFSMVFYNPLEHRRSISPRTSDVSRSGTTCTWRRGRRWAACSPIPARHP